MLVACLWAVTRPKKGKSSSEGEIPVVGLYATRSSVGNGRAGWRGRPLIFLTSILGQGNQ